MLRTPKLTSRGVELSLQAVIIAVIVLVVLVVLILIFTRGSGGFYTGATNCGDRGGTCKSECDPDESAYALGLSGADCSKETKCCIPERKIFGQEE